LSSTLSLLVGGVLELLLEVRHVVVAELVAAAEPEATPIDDAGVIEAVEERDVRAVEQARQHSQVDLVAGGEDEHGGRDPAQPVP
jgi:hypothetical protein